MKVVGIGNRALPEASGIFFVGETLEAPSGSDALVFFIGLNFLLLL